MSEFGKHFETNRSGELEIEGIPATTLAEPPYDPSNAKLRA